MKKIEQQTIHLRPVPHDAWIKKHPDCIECYPPKNDATAIMKASIKDAEQESAQQQRTRIAEKLTSEVKAWKDGGMPDEVLGLKIFDALIDVNVELENYKAIASRLAIQLGKELNLIVEDVKTSKFR